MILVCKLTLAMLIASVLNFIIYLGLGHISTLSINELAIVRIFTGVPIGVFFSNLVLVGYNKK